MLEGKVGAALKFLDENATNSVLHPNQEVIAKLRKLHPQPAEILPESLIQQGPIDRVSPTKFSDIDEQLILKAANYTKGSGGPSLMDANQWRRVIGSNHFKHEAKELRENLAVFAKKIASEIIDPEILEPYTANRLLPLDKNPGGEELQIRPIGVGEVLRRIIGKTISWSLSQDIQEAAGPLQVATGLKGGAEAAIHAMKTIFHNEASDAVILVDAENAFNLLNRMVALHNMQYLCPPLATVLINTYRRPARLFIVGGGEIPSEEGTTQGDTLATAFYGISTKPLIDILQLIVAAIKQVWLADDATGAGRLHALREWWDAITREGKKYGYHVKPSKSWLILKDPNQLAEAEELFRDAPIKITTEGKRHLGAALGTDNFKHDYITEMVTEWCKQLKVLSTIAKSQPHVAYTGYTHGMKHKFTYFIRTLEGIAEALTPIDEVLNNDFIPALFGTQITEADRELLALPIKDGGLGIPLINTSASTSREASIMLTKPLTTAIINQSTTLPNENEVKSAKAKSLEVITKAKEHIKSGVLGSLSPERKRTMEELSMPGASSWLGALPLKSQNMDLNKGEFQDALALRYDLRPKNLPSKCACGNNFDATHAMNCHRGGFINARHDNVRNFDAKLLQDVCRDVQLEPLLQPVPEGRQFRNSVNTSSEARADIRAKGFWRDGQDSFFDIRITNTTANSQVNTPIESVLRKHEMDKKRTYNTRIMEIDHGTFTPIVITTKGVMGRECEKFHKALAEKLAVKKEEKYEEVIRYIRVKMSFLALKSALLCLRGTRAKVREQTFHENENFGFLLRDLNV